MSTIKRIANAVKVAIQSPEPLRLEASSFGTPVTALPRSDMNSVEVNGRVYKLFFLVGHARSGTNWTGAILNRHPQINSHGEFRFEALRTGFDDLTRHSWHAAHHEPMRSVAERCFKDSVRQVLGALATRRPDSEWIGDRTPRSLDTFLPDAPHFLIIRDPRDMLVSLVHREFVHGGFNFRQDAFRDRLTPARQRFLDDPNHFKDHPEELFGDEAFLRYLAGKWTRHMLHDLEVLASIERGERSTPVHVLRYETLHADPEGERAKMYQFLGLEPNEAESLSHDSMSAPGFKRSEDPRKFYRKGGVGDWKTYFHDDAKRWFKEESHGLLVRLGYEQDEAW